jgi:hypothetical protein
VCGAWRVGLSILDVPRLVPHDATTESQDAIPLTKF